MTITVDLTKEQAEAFLEFLQEAPFQNSLVEDASGLVRIAIRKALGDLPGK